MSNPPSNRKKHQIPRKRHGVKQVKYEKKLCKYSECKGQVMVKTRVWKSHQTKDAVGAKQKKSRGHVGGRGQMPSEQTRPNPFQDSYQFYDSGELEEDVKVVGDDARAPLPQEPKPSRQSKRTVDEKLVYVNGRLRRGTILDLLVEQASAHNIPREAMEGIVYIINILALDGGADEPILPSYAAFDKAFVRAGQEVVEK
eukprot:g75401.t1